MRKQTKSIIVLLVIQFALGMVLDLFVKLPDVHPGAAGDYFSVRIPQGLLWAFTEGGGIWLMLHAIVGTLLLVIGISHFIMAIRTHNGKTIAFSFFGFLFMLFAWFSGVNFINLGGHNANSIVMALNFLAAFLFYGAVLMTLPSPKKFVLVPPVPHT